MAIGFGCFAFFRWLSVLAAERGAVSIRTHDVAATVDALAMWTALKEVGG